MGAGSWIDRQKPNEREQDMNARQQVLQHMPKNAVCAEVGVHLGDYSAKIINRTNPKKLYLIDPWQVIEDEKYAKSWFGKKVAQREMDQRYKSVQKRFADNPAVEILRDFSKGAVEHIPDGSLDFVYLDGDHSYEGVCLDFDLFYDKVKPNGLIYGDDYTDQFWWGTGVIDALHKNLYEKDLRLVFLNGTQFCCRKMG